MITRKRSGLPEQLEALSHAVVSADGRLEIEDVAFAQQVLNKAEARLKHGTTNTLVALLGATGAGKSSVTNALVGNDVATTGVRRPTTSSTLGCFWGDDDVQPLLDWLEVKNRHHVPAERASADEAEQQVTSSLNGLVLLDVPDHDSVAVAHREEMERIAEHADLLLWVTDSEKYADKAMHDYLRRLGEHGTVTAMILNKADQLDEASQKACVEDLTRLLANDGLDKAPVFLVSARTGHGVPAVVKLLEQTVGEQRAAVERLQADTRVAAKTLLDGLGHDSGSDTVPGKVTKQLASELVEASGLTVVTDAVQAGHRRDAAKRVGWPFTRWVRQLRPHPLRRLHLGQGSGGRSTLPEASGAQRSRVDGAIRSATSAVTADLPQPWPELISEAGSPDQSELNDRLDRAISESVRTHNDKNPAWWHLINTLQIAVAVAALAGLAWLGLIALAAYFRIPELPTPEYREVPIPTGLALGGLAIGLLLAFLAGRFAAVGAKRRARAVRKEAERQVGVVANEMIVNPMQEELDRRKDLRSQLETAFGE